MKLTLKDYLRAILSTSDPKTKEEWEEYFWIEEKLLEEEAKYDLERKLEWEKLQIEKERKREYEMEKIYYSF